MSSLFGSFGQSGAPGHLSSFDIGTVNAARGLSTQAMQNRYAQLGLASQGATPTTPGSGLGQSTAEMMDVGTLPSYTGGIQGQFDALLGELQNNALAVSPQGTGKSTSPASIIGSVGALSRLKG